MDTQLNQQTVINIQVTPEQFQMIGEWFSEIQETRKQADRLLTPEQVAAMLGVTLPTLWRWNKSGYLKKTMIGNKPRYHESDVKAIMDERK